MAMAVEIAGGSLITARLISQKKPPTISVNAEAKNLENFQAKIYVNIGP
jgi:hypothetical protein